MLLKTSQSKAEVVNGELTVSGDVTKKNAKKNQAVYRYIKVGKMQIITIS